MGQTRGGVVNVVCGWGRGGCGGAVNEVRDG